MVYGQCKKKSWSGSLMAHSKAKVDSLLAELHQTSQKVDVPQKPFKKLRGWLLHACIGIPVGWNLMGPINNALAMGQSWIHIGTNPLLKQCLWWFSHHYQDHVQMTNILQGINCWHTWVFGILQCIQACSWQHMDVGNKIHPSTNGMATRVSTRHPEACHLIWQSRRRHNKLRSQHGRGVGRIPGRWAPNIITSAGQTSLAPPDHDKICTASCTYIQVPSLCHLYPLPFTWRITNENFQRYYSHAILLTTLHLKEMT